MSLDIIIIITSVIISLVIGYIIGKWITNMKRNAALQHIIQNERMDAIKKSRSILGGQFAEQLAPYLPDFPYKPTECRFIGKPVDFIAFKGLDEKNVDEIIFVEVKSAKAKLSHVEMSIRDAIERKNVHWEKYHVSRDIT